MSCFQLHMQEIIIISGIRSCVQSCESHAGLVCYNQAISGCSGLSSVADRVVSSWRLFTCIHTPQVMMVQSATVQHIGKTHATQLKEPLHGNTQTDV